MPKRKLSYSPANLTASEYRCEIVGYVRWLTHGMLEGAHINRLKPNLDEQIAFAHIQPRRPPGLRDLLDDDHPVVVEMRQRFQSKDSRLKRPLASPQRREDVRPLLAMRLRFLFDWGVRTSWKTMPVQTAEIEDACEHVLGWTFEDAVAIFEWAWDNQVHHGRGEPPFRRLWKRDLSSFNRLYQEKREKVLKAGAPEPFLRGLTDTRRKFKSDRVSPLDALDYIARDIFELERAQDCIAGLLDLTSGQNATDWYKNAVLRTEVSPIVLVLAAQEDCPVETGNIGQHAALAASNLRSIKLRSHAASGHHLDPWDRWLGYEDLGFATHVLLWIAGRRTEHFRKYRGTKGDGDRESKLFRLAINFLAWVDPQRAQKHLARRLSEERDPTASRIVLARETSGISVFTGMRRMRAPEDELENDGQPDDPVTTVLQHSFVGESFVTEQRTFEHQLVARGFQDLAMNPLLRAYFCPEAWTADIGEASLVDAWTKRRSSLERAEPGYAAKIKKRQFDTATAVALLLSECVVAPLTDRILACAKGQLESVLSPQPGSAVNLVSDETYKPEKNTRDLLSSPRHVRKSVRFKQGRRRKESTKLLATRR